MCMTINPPSSERVMVVAMLFWINFLLLFTSWIYPPSHDTDISCPDDYLVYYRFLGRVMGRALFDRQLMKGPLVRHLYKHLLGLPRLDCCNLSLEYQGCHPEGFLYCKEMMEISKSLPFMEWIKIPVFTHEHIHVSIVLTYPTNSQRRSLKRNLGWLWPLLALVLGWSRQNAKIMTSLPFLYGCIGCKHYKLSILCVETSFK